MFQHNRQDFRHQHAQVQHHAHGHFPQKGVGLPEDNRMPETQRLTKVKQQHHARGGIAEKSQQDSKFADHFKAFDAQDVDDHAKDKGASTHGNGREVHRNPQPPGNGIG